MKMFKRISLQFFPQLAKKEEEKERHSYILSKSTLFMSSFWLSETDEELKNQTKAFIYFFNSLTEIEQIKYKSLLLKVEDSFKYAENLIDSPKEAALNLDKYLNSFIEQMRPLQIPQNILLERLSENSCRCAVYSIIATLNESLSKDEKIEQLGLQQGRLNIAIQNYSNIQKETNYWYALHWFIRENTHNSEFFLRNLFKDKETTQKMSWLIDNSNNWLKEKIPQDFHGLVKKVFSEYNHTNIYEGIRKQKTNIY